MFQFQRSNNSEDAHTYWGMDRCWRCQGDGEIIVNRPCQSSSAMHEEPETRTCPDCDGTGMVPKC